MFVIVCYVDYVQCPYCSRRFNQTAAQRHINFCKEQQSRLPNKKQPDKTALQRAEARKQVSTAAMCSNLQEL